MEGTKASSSWDSAWESARAICYELKPFDLPTREEVKSYLAWLAANAAILCREAARFIVELATVAKSAAAELPPGTAVKLGCWSAGWAGAVWAELGAPYLIVSAIAVVLSNLGESSDAGGPSAFSVFNEGCRSLMGSLNARQLEQQMLHQNPVARDDDQEWVIVDPRGNAGGGGRNGAAAAAPGGGGGGGGGGGTNNAVRRRKAKKRAAAAAAGAGAEQQRWLQEEEDAARAAFGDGAVFDDEED